MKCPHCGTDLDKHKPQQYITKSKITCYNCGYWQEIKVVKQKVVVNEPKKPESGHKINFV
jgi:uncharacterized Zn finger protein